MRRCCHTKGEAATTIHEGDRAAVTVGDEGDREGEMIRAWGMREQPGAREESPVTYKGGVMGLVVPIVISGHAHATQKDLPQTQARHYSMYRASPTQ